MHNVIKHFESQVQKIRAAKVDGPALLKQWLKGGWAWTFHPIEQQVTVLGTEAIEVIGELVADRRVYVRALLSASGIEDYSANFNDNARGVSISFQMPVSAHRSDDDHEPLYRMASAIIALGLTEPASVK